MKSKSKLIGYIIGIVLFVCLLGGITYAIVVWRTTDYNISLTGKCFDVEGDTSITLQGGDMILFDEDNIIDSNAGIITYKKGMLYAPFKVTRGNCDIDTYFDIVINVTNLSNDYTNGSIKYKVINDISLYYSESEYTNPLNKNLSYIESESGTITSTGTTTLYSSNISKNTTEVPAIVVYIDGDLVPNNASNLALSASIEVIANQGVYNPATPGSAAEYITNLYTNANKTEYTDSMYNITYNYATSVNLMNDRLASMDTNINGGNIRYYGSDPDNYVTFNNELWRIIGVFDGRLKLIRKDDIGGLSGGFTYDTSAYNINDGYGVSQWGPSVHLDDGSVYNGADLMKLLNPGYEQNIDKKCLAGSTITNSVFNCGDNASDKFDDILVNNSLYWNAEAGSCYNSGAYNTKSCDFTSSGLRDSTSKAMIDQVLWNTGANSEGNVYNGQITGAKMYEWNYSNALSIWCTRDSAKCSSDVLGTATWIGKVGLMYPSDYIYATGGGTDGLNTCLSNHAATVSNNSISNWGRIYAGCSDDDWLSDTSGLQWTMNPRASATTSYIIFAINNAGYISDAGTHAGAKVRPVVFLKRNVAITGGTGVSEDPYVLSLS